nr:uncharacterized protein LOC123570573 [Macaca fascicularis]
MGWVPSGALGELGPAQAQLSGRRAALGAVPAPQTTPRRTCSWMSCSRELLSIEPGRGPGSAAAAGRGCSADDSAPPQPARSARSARRRAWAASPSRPPARPCRTRRHARPRHARTLHADAHPGQEPPPASTASQCRPPPPLWRSSSTLEDLRGSRWLTQCSLRFMFPRLQLLSCGRHTPSSSHAPPHLARQQGSPSPCMAATATLG